MAEWFLNTWQASDLFQTIVNQSVQVRLILIIAVEIYHFGKIFTISKLSLGSIQRKSFQIPNPEITLGGNILVYF